jgi:hypothetical protein
MTQEEKTHYTQLALCAVGYGCDLFMADMIIRIVNLVEKQGGDVDLKMICRLQAQIEAKYSQVLAPEPEPKNNNQQQLEFPA